MTFLNFIHTLHNIPSAQIYRYDEEIHRMDEQRIYWVSGDIQTNEGASEERDSTQGNGLHIGTGS